MNHRSVTTLANILILHLSLLISSKLVLFTSASSITPRFQSLVRMRRGAFTKSLQTLAFHNPRPNSCRWINKAASDNCIPKLHSVVGINTDPLCFNTVQEGPHYKGGVNQLVTSCNSRPSSLRLFATSTSSQQEFNMKHYDTLESTQDEARKILNDKSAHGKPRESLCTSIFTYVSSIIMLKTIIDSLTPKY